MKKDSSNLTAQDIKDHTFALLELAYESGQIAAGLKACEMLGKELGLWRDRRENLNINISNLTPQETEQYIQDRYGDKAELFLTMYRKLYNAETIDHDPDVASGLVAQRVQRPKLSLVHDDSQDD